MAYFLLSLLWISAAALLGAVASGLGLFHVGSPIRLHVYLAGPALTLALSAHAMTLVYALRRGERIKRILATGSTEELEDALGRFVQPRKKIMFPLIFAAVLLLGVGVLGVAVYCGRVQMAAHEYAAFAGLLVHVHVASRETLFLFKTITLTEEIEDEARRRADCAPSGPPA